MKAWRKRAALACKAAFATLVGAALGCCQACGIQPGTEIPRPPTSHAPSKARVLIIDTDSFDVYDRDLWVDAVEFLDSAVGLAPELLFQPCAPESRYCATQHQPLHNEINESVLGLTDRVDMWIKIRRDLHPDRKKRAVIVHELIHYIIADTIDDHTLLPSLMSAVTPSDDTLVPWFRCLEPITVEQICERNPCARTVGGCLL